MDRFFPLFITFLLFTALGCAKDKRAAVTSTPSSTLSSNDPCTAINCQQATPPELNATQRLAKNVQVSCKENDCDPSVGLLSIVDKGETAWSAGQCTASLIGSDILVTNGHCIPNDLAKEGSSCLNRLWITFPNDPNHPEYDRQIDCGQILFRKKEGGTEGSDYAYIKLARPSNRPVLRQSIEGFENETLYRLHKFNPIRMPGGIGGMFEIGRAHV